MKRIRSFMSKLARVHAANTDSRSDNAVRKFRFYQKCAHFFHVFVCINFRIHTHDFHQHFVYVLQPRATLYSAAAIRLQSLAYRIEPTRRLWPGGHSAIFYYGTAHAQLNNVSLVQHADRYLRVLIDRYHHQTSITECATLWMIASRTQ